MPHRLGVSTPDPTAGAHLDVSRAKPPTEFVRREADDPTEEYILFRYNVRYLNPIEEFQKFVKNVVNYHHGQPYWEPVNWYTIVPVRRS